MIKGKNTSCITTLNSQKNEYNSRKFSAFSVLFFSLSQKTRICDERGKGIPPKPPPTKKKKKMIDPKPKTLRNKCFL